MKNNNNAVGLTLPGSNTYYKATVFNKVWHWHKDRHIDHFGRRKNPEIDLCGYTQLIANKDAKLIQWRKESVSRD